MFYLCYIYVSCIEHVCIIYALSMKQQRSNGRADVPQGGKSAENGLMEGMEGMEQMDGMERMERMEGKYVRGIFFGRRKKSLEGHSKEHLF